MIVLYSLNYLLIRFRAYLVVRSRLCYSVASVVSRRLSVTLCIVAKRGVLEQMLLLLLRAYRKSRVYEKSIGTKMNDLFITFV